MLQFNPNDPGDTPYKLQRAVSESGLTLQQVCDRLNSGELVKMISQRKGRPNRAALDRQPFTLALWFDPGLL